VIYIGDCREVLKTLPDESVHCVVTSSPYFGLRSYLPDDHPDKDKEIGLEETPEAFVAALVDVFREVRRVLRRDGVAYIVIGDSYAGGGGGNYSKSKKQTAHGEHITNIRNRADWLDRAHLKPKDRMMIPARVALALQADGWWLRDEIIWSKPNPMPSSTTDRTTSAHEMIYMLSKSARYWYDAEAVKERYADDRNGNPGYIKPRPEKATGPMDRGGNSQWEKRGEYRDLGGRNRRSVWTVATQPYKESHFAVFPQKLIEPMILAGCPAQACAKCGKPWERVVEITRVKLSNTPGRGGRQTVPGQETSKTSCFRTNLVPRSTTLGHRPACACAADSIPGTVLDPFFGSGTVGQVAERLGRAWIGIDLNDGYSAMQQKRTAQRGLGL